MIRMKNFKLLLTSLFLVLFFFVSTVYAEQYAEKLSEMKGPVHKFGRGHIYLLAAPFQIFKDVIQTGAETKPFYLATLKGPTIGLGLGVYDTARQFLSGLFDIFTFYTPAGRDWKPLCAPETMIPEV